MISNQILQGTIDGLKSISRVELCVVDTEGKEVVSTTTNLNDVSRTASEFATSPADLDGDGERDVWLPATLAQVEASFAELAIARRPASQRQRRQ